MASGDLGSLLVSIGVNTKELDKGLKGATSSIQSFQGSVNKILGLIGFSLTAKAFFDLGKATLDWGDKLNDLSETTGIAASKIAELQFAAEQSGTSVDALVKNMSVLARRMNEASGGSESAINIFRQFQIEIKNSDGSLRNVNDVLLEVADRIKNTTNPTLALAAAQELLGKSAQETLQFLKQGSAGLQAMAAQFEKMGGNAERIDRFAKASDALKDKWSALQKEFQLRVLLPIMEELIPLFDDFAENIKNIDWDSFANTAINGINLTINAVMILVEWWQKLEKSVAGVAAFWGAMFGGASMDQAVKAKVGAEADPFAAGGGPTTTLPEVVVTAPAEETEGDGEGLGVQDSMESKMSGFQTKMKEISEEWGNLQKGMEEVGLAFINTYVTSFGTAFADIATGAKTFSEAFKSMFESLAQAVLQMIGEMIAKMLIFLALNAATGGTFGAGKSMLSFMGLRDGGMVSARNGLLYAADGAMATGHFGEGGIPAMLHPGEVVAPFDKVADMLKSASGQGSITVNIQGSVDDPRKFAELVAFEVDRRRRSP